MLSLFMEYKRNVSLAPFTTVKIGGPAEFCIEITSYRQFKAVLEELKNKKITILGNGSNVLISDKGLKDYVLINSTNKIKILKNDQIYAESGTQLAHLIEFSLKHGLVGLETFAYIPSTLGRAIAGNIHGPKCLFSSIIKSVEYGKHNNPIILSAILQLKKGDVVAAKKIYQEIIAKKSLSQPMNSLGCIFKNIGDQSVGEIIDKKLKLKGLSIGDAKISEKHANFIENIGQATARDYYSLINLIQDKAKKELNLDLELEIKLLGQI